MLAMNVMTLALAEVLQQCFPLQAGLERTFELHFAAWKVVVLGIDDEKSCVHMFSTSGTISPLFA